MRPYLTLALAIAAEVTGTAALKASDGFAHLLPSAVVVVGYVGSFYLLGLTLEDLPVGLVYATWAGAGIVGTALLGVVVFEERIDVAAVVGMALVVAGVLVLNVLSEAYAPAH
ncbi:DMT family transporter [Halosimplex salinum]|uniref:DMT family transporter n=1 Tax=Halosimplex salinum TaxID=1710538 RepID=UPI000F46547B|nr:multidrug efflux SMR transporter [Halosimplex salinum]